MTASGERTRRFFDQRAPAYYESNYEHPQNRHAYNLALRREACLSLVPPPDGLVLDLGCGPGAMTVPLVTRGYDVVATDISAGMVSEAIANARRAGANIHAAVADAVALPFAAESFGAVVTTGVLEYVADTAAALAEIARVLRPSGTLIATMSLPRRFERFVVNAASALRGRPRSVAQYIRDRASFDRMIEAAGLTIEKRLCCSFAPFPLDAIWARSVPLIDHLCGDALNRVDAACDHAKTYIIRARRRP